MEKKCASWKKKESGEFTAGNESGYSVQELLINNLLPFTALFGLLIKINQLYFFLNALRAVIFLLSCMQWVVLVTIDKGLVIILKLMKNMFLMTVELYF